MRKILISLYTLVLSSVALASEEQNVENVWSIDSTGKPPFKRTVKQQPVNNVVRLELVEEVVAIRVKTGSRPPFKRRTVYIPVSEVVQFELKDNKSKMRYRGKPPFRR